MGLSNYDAVNTLYNRDSIVYIIENVQTVFSKKRQLAQKCEYFAEQIPTDLTSCSRVLLEKPKFPSYSRSSLHLWKAQVHYNIHKSPPPGVILSQKKPVHASPTHHETPIKYSRILTTQSSVHIKVNLC